MSKQNYAEPGKCTRCKHQDATRANECRTCHYVTLVMVQIHSIWDERELEDLADDLRNTSVHEFQATAKANGAYLRVKIANAIFRLSFPAKVTPDDLRRRVVAAIGEYIGELEGIRAYEAKPGNAGAWKRFTRETVASWVGKATHAKI
jgi:hypothetical protein